MQIYPYYLQNSPIRLPQQPQFGMENKVLDRLEAETSSDPIPTGLPSRGKFKVKSKHTLRQLGLEYFVKTLPIDEPRIEVYRQTTPIANVNIKPTEKHGIVLLHSVAVHPHYRRYGIARWLMNEMIRLIKRLKVFSEIRLQVDRKSRRFNELESFYRSLGFENPRPWKLLDNKPDLLELALVLDSTNEPRKTTRKRDCKPRKK